MYRIYKLLRGTLAFSIFLGLLFFYFAWWLVRILGMDLLSSVLDQFVNVGVIIIVIIFQPEIRKFLLMLGRGASSGRFKNMSRFFKQSNGLGYTIESIEQLIQSLNEMSMHKTGALIVFADNVDTDTFEHNGVEIKSKLVKSMILSIFNKNSPLHDGAMILKDGQIHRVSSVLPITKRENLPQHFGLRHRAAIGVTEELNVVAILVSEETGSIAMAQYGQLQDNIELKFLKNKLIKEYVQDLEAVVN